MIPFLIPQLFLRVDLQGMTARWIVRHSSRPGATVSDNPLLKYSSGFCILTLAHTLPFYPLYLRPFPSAIFSHPLSVMSLSTILSYPFFHTRMHAPNTHTHTHKHRHAHAHTQTFFYLPCSPLLSLLTTINTLRLPPILFLPPRRLLHDPTGYDICFKCAG